MSPVELPSVTEEARHGGKAVGLGAALRAGLPVPNGFGLDYEFVNSLCLETSSHSRLELLGDLLEEPLAVRSSALGEDSSSASFAGQHVTRLNVRGLDSLLEALNDVRDSGTSAGALAYRKTMGILHPPRVAVVIQRLISPTVSGVLFTKNPVTGADERIIEATWGLGEAVVSGLVTPDRWRLRRGGEILDHDLGEKDVEIVPSIGGGTEEREVEHPRAQIMSLNTSQVAALDDLATRCERHFSGASDIEWAFFHDKLFLLQRREITR